LHPLLITPQVVDGAGSTAAVRSPFPRVHDDGRNCNVILSIVS